MNNFRAIFFMVKKRFLSKKNLLFIAAILILALYATKLGITEHNQILKNSTEFKTIQKSRFKNLKDYDDYSNKGINLYFVPSGSMVFFSNPDILNELSGNVNSIINLNISNNCKGGLVLRSNSPFRLRFSNIVLVLGNLAALLLGFDRLQTREFLKFLSSHWTTGKIHLAIIVSKLILFFSCLTIIFGVCLGLALLKKVSFTAGDFSGMFHSLLPMVLMLTVSFFAGDIMRSFKAVRKKAAEYHGVYIFWFILVFILPGARDAEIEKISFKIPSPYKLENKKLKIVNDFEKNTDDKYGKLNMNNIETERMIVEGYCENELKRIQALENQLKAEISSAVRKYHHLSMWVPTTFYTASCTGISSRGYMSYLDFYTYSLEMYLGFTRFWIDRVYYHDLGVLVSFIKANEDLFKSMSRVPMNYWQGNFISLGYVIILSVVSFLLFEKSLFQTCKSEIEELGKVNLKMDKEELIVLQVKGKQMNKLLFAALSGKIKLIAKKRFNGDIKINGISILKEKIKTGFLYLCMLSELPPDIKVKDFIAFYARWNRVSRKKKKDIITRWESKKTAHKTIGNIEDHEKFDLLMDLLQMKKSPVYLVDCITVGLPISCSIRLKDRMDELKDRGALVIYLTTQKLVEDYSEETGKCVEDGKDWLDMVGFHKKKLKLKDK